MPKTSPISYTVRLAPDLEKLTFSGSVAIEVQLQHPGESVVLDSVGLEVTACTVRRDGVEIVSGYTVDETSVAVRCPGVREGKVTVSLEFNGKLERALFGFYDSPYERNGLVKHLAVTQFESDYARRAFPCLDHPRYNTPFSIELVAPPGTIAVSNSPVETVEPVEGGSLYRFEATPPMPTYLLFFGVGDFGCIEDDNFRVPVRAVALPEKVAYADRAIETAKASITFCEDFTGIDYPMAKLDLIGIPTFAFGAMENFGAITYRENLLLYVPGTTSERGFERNSLITAHEVAHMWFGNLVSPAEWRFVWLNEAFATYLEYLIGEAVFPERRIDECFLFEGFIVAYTRDSLIRTIPIELPEGLSLEVDASTAPIFYDKAALVLRMAHCWLGDEKFRKGVRSYLTEFAYQSTDTAGFLESFARGAGAEASGMIENWIRQPGFPLVRAERHGEKLRLEQDRFTWLEHASEQVWHIPVSLQLFDDHGEAERRSFLMKEKTATVELPEGTSAYKLNAGQIGIFHTAYERENLLRLGALAREGRLGTGDRYGLALDLSALVMRREVTVDEFLHFLLEYYINEREYLPLTGIATVLRRLWRVAATKRANIADAGRRIFGPVIDRIGIAPAAGEDHLNVLLRSELLWPAVLFGSESVCEELARRFESFAAGETVEADLLQSTFLAGAYLSTARFDQFREIMEDPRSADEMKVYLYRATGWFQDPGALTRVLGYVEESIGEQNRIYVYRSLATNPAAGKFLFGWLGANLGKLESVHPYTSSVAVAEIIPVCEPEDEADLDALLDGCTFSDPSLVQSIAAARELRTVYRSLQNAR